MTAKTNLQNIRNLGTKDKKKKIVQREEMRVEAEFLFGPCASIALGFGSMVGRGHEKTPLKVDEKGKPV